MTLQPNIIHRALVGVVLVTTVAGAVLDPTATLDCHKRMYSYKVTQADSEGRICWDTITVMSCWGRCDSNEISDWRFPFKRSYHPVCQHGVREPRSTVLKHCEEGAEAGTERHEYLNALSCSCRACRSSEASCQGLRGRLLKDGTDLMMASREDSVWGKVEDDQDGA